MRLVTYRTTPAGQARLGAVVGDRVVDLARLGSVAGVPLPDDMLAALWAYCDGSARVLNENLIPAIRDYGVGRAPMSAELVHQIAEKVLFMQRPRAAGGK